MNGDELRKTLADRCHFVRESKNHLLYEFNKGDRAVLDLLTEYHKTHFGQPIPFVYEHYAVRFESFLPHIERSYRLRINKK